MKRCIQKQLGLLSHETHGAEIAELASVLPLLVVLIFGILWFGRAFNIYTTVNRATREAAEAAARKTPSTLGNQVITDSDIKINVVEPILIASHLDPSQADLTILHHVLTLNSGANVPVATVTIAYPYTFKLNGLTCCPPTIVPLLDRGITITVNAQAQEEQ